MSSHLHLSRLWRIVGIASGLLWSAFSGLADDKPRVLITVSKGPSAKPAAKIPGDEEPGPRQSLFVTVVNRSSGGLPEGSLRWTAVVRRASGDAYLYSGSEPVKALRSLQSVEIQCGALRSSGTERHRIEYEVVVLHDEKESGRTVSIPTFAALAENAQAMGKGGENGQQNNNDDEQAPKKPKDEKPAVPAIIGAEKMTPSKPALPVAQVAKSAVKPLAEPPPPAPSVDFFNLGGKQAPAAK